MPHLQNFSVPAGNDVTLYVDVLTDIPMETIQGATVYWRVYEQFYGAAQTGLDPIISKSTDDDITIPASPDMTFTIVLTRHDLAGLIGNYYHEATVIGDDGGLVTVMVGTMTVTTAENLIA